MLAMLNYESANGHFPPAYIADDDGKPMHSWRVLILPFLEGNHIYDQYDFSEPWDGPNNSKLVDQLGTHSCFSCPGQENLGNRTTYKLVTGPGTAFEDDKSSTLAKLTSGASNTIAILEDTSNPVNWMQPVDLSIDQAIDLYNFKKTPKTMHHIHETKFERRTWHSSNCAFFDGSIRYIAPLKEPEILGKWFTNDSVPRNWESVEDNIANHGGSTVKLSYGYMLVALNILIAVLPFLWRRPAVVSLDDPRRWNC